MNGKESFEQGGGVDRRRIGRRGFVAGAGATALGLAAGVGPARAGEFTGKIKKAVKYHMIEKKMSVLDNFKMLVDLGFDGTEMRTADGANTVEVVKAIEKTGLPVHGIVNGSDPDLVNAIEVSESLGGTSVLTLCRYDKSVSLQANWDRDIANIRSAIPAAEKLGIKLLVENVWASYLISAFDVRSFLDEVDSPWVGSYFDVGNNVRWGVAKDWIPLLGKRIVKLDIKEYDDKKHNSEGLRAGFNVELGEGSVDWSAVRKELGAIGFEGWGTAEVKGGGRERLKEIAERMDRVLGL